MIEEEEINVEQLVREARKARAEFHEAERIFETARLTYEKAAKNLEATTQISLEARCRLFTYFDKELDRIQEDILMIE